MARERTNKRANKWLFRLFRIETMVLLLGVLILFMQLFSKPFTGVADNGDFLRIMGSIGLDYGTPGESYEDRFFNFAHREFAYNQFFRGFYLSSQLLLVAAARTAGWLWNSMYFDIRVLAIIYSCLLLSAAYTLVAYYKRILVFNDNKSWMEPRSTVQPLNLSKAVATALMAALLLFVFFDIGYTAYFNSLYGEPVSQIFLLLICALGLKLALENEPRPNMLLLFYVCILFLIGSKTQNAPIGLGFALLGVRYATIYSERGWRRLAYVLATVTAAASIILYMGAPREFKQINLYQTVFFGIMKNTSTAKADLQKLGLPEHLSVLAGTNYFEAGTAIKQDASSMKADFYDRISHSDVMKFYLKHPSRLFDNLQAAAAYGTAIRPYYLGNFEKSEGRSPQELSFVFSSWSELKYKYLPKQLWFMLLVMGLGAVIAIAEWLRAKRKQHRVAAELFFLIAVLALFSFIIPVVGDGMADLSKHLFMFNVAFDVLLLALISWFMFRLARLVK